MTLWNKLLFTWLARAGVAVDVSGVNLSEGKNASNSPISTEVTDQEKQFPLTTELIEAYYAELLQWIGFEEGRGDRLIANDPSLAKLNPNHLNYNFDVTENGSCAARMVNDAFLDKLNRPCEVEDFVHIYNNSLQLFAFYPWNNGLLEEDRSAVIKFLVEDRSDLLRATQARPTFEPENDPTFLHLTAKMRLMCFDKFAELMMGDFIAAEIVRDSEQQMAQRSSQTSAKR